MNGQAAPVQAAAEWLAPVILNPAHGPARNRATRWKKSRTSFSAPAEIAGAVGRTRPEVPGREPAGVGRVRDGAPTSKIVRARVQHAE